MNPTCFIIVRHGETEWNLVGREMGQLDSPLTNAGIKGAERLADRLKATGFDVLYSSDLGRAAQTSEIISTKCSCRVVFDPRLRERNMGIFQGLTDCERKEKYPEECEAYRKIGGSYMIPDGESAEQRLARTVECLDELARRHDGGTVVVVTHGGILMGFFEYVLGLPFRSGERFRRPNTAWNVFTRENDKWILEIWGDISHLQTSGREKAAQPAGGANPDKSQ